LLNIAVVISPSQLQQVSMLILISTRGRTDTKNPFRDPVVPGKSLFESPISRPRKCPIVLKFDTLPLVHCGSGKDVELWK